MARTMPRMCKVSRVYSAPKGLLTEAKKKKKEQLKEVTFLQTPKRKVRSAFLKQKSVGSLYSQVLQFNNNL